jgi:hypothetical protein
MVCSQRIEQITACLDGVTTALQSTHPDALLHEQRDWLASRIEKLRDERAALHFPAPPWFTRTLILASRSEQRTTWSLLLGDWGHVAVESSEWDFAQIYYTS